MHSPEALILRRCYPVPVTFADLRAAFESMTEYPVAVSVRHLDHIATHWTWGGTEEQYMPIRRDMTDLAVKVRSDFAAALKEATGAIDEVYAVVDGREVRVAVIDKEAKSLRVLCGNELKIGAMLDDLLDKADRDGYWARPHEVRINLQERPVSHDEVARAVLVGQEYVERSGGVR